MNIVPILGKPRLERDTIAVLDWAELAAKLVG